MRDHWQQRLAELVRVHGIPGASVAILDDGEVTAVAAGVLHTGTGVEATTDSLFQIGSITKVYTTSVLMRLVDQGLVSVDTRVVDVLPEFRVADPEVAGQVTLRHLLTHTSGIGGDFFHDTGRGDECLARYVEACGELAQTHPLGATQSYCNTGFSILGRIIERLTGSVWDDALAELLVKPLGLTQTWTLPEDVLRFRAAMGHQTGSADDPPRPAPRWGLMRSAGPAGIICASASDVVAFARMHLDSGCAGDGTRILTEEAVSAMQQPQVKVPNPHGFANQLGLSWMLFDWDGRRVYGHDGGTIGQTASLRVVPDSRIAVAVLTNTDRSSAFLHQVFSELFDELCDLAKPAPPEPPDSPPPTTVDRHVGRYERVGERFEVTERDGKLNVHIELTGELASLQPPVDVALIPLDGDLLLGRLPNSTRWSSFYFYELPDGSRYLHDGSRATPKVG
jgi:CubicO group peptidase (beta-lactamase class C family)